MRSNGRWPSSRADSPGSPPVQAWGRCRPSTWRCSTRARTWSAPRASTGRRGCSRRKHLSRFGVESSWIDTTDLGNLRRAMRPTTRIVYTESVANPTMDVTDIRGAAEIAHEHGALLVVDNTFCSPFLHRPIEFGADVVLHSVTKFLNGTRTSSARRRRQDGSALPETPPDDDDARVQHGPPPGVPGVAGAEDAVAAHRASPSQRHDHRQLARAPAAGRVGPVRPDYPPTPSTISQSGR